MSNVEVVLDQPDDKEPETPFTVWCRQSDGRGTTWVSEVHAESKEDAIEKGRELCMMDWGYVEGSEDAIRVVGVQPAFSGIDSLVWDDAGLDGQQDHEVVADEPA